MSAFIINEKIIATLACYAARNECCKYGIHFENQLLTAKEIAKVLAKANIDSIDYRYKNQYIEDNIENRIYTKNAITHAKAINPDVFPSGYIAKQLDCYAYQSCERDDWFQSNAFKIITNIRADLTKQLADYETASWGMEY